MTTTTSEAATEAMAEARKKWIEYCRRTTGWVWRGGQMTTPEIGYEAGWRAALAYAAKEESGE